MFKIQKILAVVSFAAGLALSPLAVAAQDSSAGTAPPLAYGVPQILKLAQAKVTDDVIIAYIHNSGGSYGLDADQIIYLRQQGISDKVLTTMLAQPRPASGAVSTAPSPANSYVTQAPVAYAPPAPADYQAAPSSSVYVIPNNQIYYSTWYPSCYPYYFYPYVSFSYGCGGGYYGGCYYRGGYCGGGYYHGYRGGYCYGNGYHGGNYGYAGGGHYGGYHGSGNYHGGVASAGHSASFGGGFHGGGMMHH